MKVYRVCRTGLVIAVVVAAWSVSAPAAAKVGGEMLKRFLAGPMKGVDEIVFAVRGRGRDGHWYANFGHWVTDANRMMYQPGGRLCAMNLRTGKVRVLIDDAKGGVRDPHVHYGGKKILLSYRKGDSRYYHLYEINVDPSTSLRAGGTGLRQITSGPQDDLEPIYLPNGEILFCSSRVNRYVQCWFTKVAVLHKCEADGTNVRLLSANVEQDNTPWVMPDGRVLYMRWEYVDRSRVRFHHLWTIGPDGTGQMTFYGNMHPSTVMLDAKPIPGTRKVVASFSPGHGRSEHMGRVTIVDPAAGPDERAWAYPVSRESDWRDPYPFSEDCFLVSRGKSLYVMDGRGRSEEIYRQTDGPKHWEAQEPRPIRPRPRERVLTERSNPSATTGTLVLSDITHGRNMAGVKPGEIRKLLVLETLPKPVNFSGTMEPISLGGTFTLPRILGTVPVEPDGSAHFEVPALRPLFFVALDANDTAVKRMQSFVSVMPGETTSCVGCHEHRTQTNRRPGALQAARRPASRIQRLRGMPEVFDFPRDVQPILDRHCVQCHNGDKYSGKVILTGDRSEIYSLAYYNLMATPGIVAHGRDADGNKPPRSLGSSGSRLMTKIDGSHHKVTLTPRERTVIRLWLDSGAPYPGTYASLGCGMVSARLDAGVMKRRCVSCHDRRRSRWMTRGARAPYDAVVNLTRPEKSLVLLAPLSKSAGGLGLCKTKDQQTEAPAIIPPEAVFADRADADYKKLLSNLQAAKAQLDKIKRFDMPGFVPNPHYLREMKAYGILPADLDPSRTKIDPYAVDEAYWRSFWYVPPAKSARGR